MADNLPGKGMFGWLGRQVGYVKKAVKTAPRPAQRPTQRPAPPAARAAEDLAPQSEAAIVYRENHVEEAEHPTQPGVKLRRTVIDEVIVEPEPTKKAE